MVRDPRPAGRAFLGSGEDATHPVTKIEMHATRLPGCGAADHVAAFSDSEPPGGDVYTFAFTSIHLQAEARDERRRIPDAGDQLTELVADRKGPDTETLTGGLEEKRECNFRTITSRSSTFEHEPMLVAIARNANFSAAQ
jgi:hypothetical protein